MERTQREQCLRALERPDHARLLEPLPDDGLAAALDDARADEPAVGAVFVGEIRTLEAPTLASRKVHGSYSLRYIMRCGLLENGCG